MRICSVCNQLVNAWEAHPNIQTRSEFTKLLEVIGSDLSVYQCPSCKCNDRERHLWLYMNSAGITDAISKMKILHIAPEIHIEQLIKKLLPQEYICGDINPSRLDQIQINVENITFESNYFDMIICNHVLEHVSQPELAINELYRCLKKGGFLIAQTPYSPLIKNKMEINVKPTHEFAKLFFGQEDHLRLFGADINDLFLNVGFDGGMIKHDVALQGIDPESAGVNGKEPFFLYAKI